MEPLGGTEQLLGVDLLVGGQGVAGGLVEGERRDVAPSPVASGQDRTRARRARVIARYASRAALAEALTLLAARPARPRPGQQRGGIQLGSGVAGGDRPSVEAEQVDVLELEPLDLLGLGQHDRSGRRGDGIVQLELARIRDRAEVANEVADRAPRLAARPGGGELGEAGQALKPLRRLGGGHEQAVAAQADPLDQAPHEDVRRASPRAPRTPRAWSFRNAWIRSRASGGSWGLSSAASSAEIMSSLRRRAIAVHRARSIERSSTGGRVSARTTAAESVGSASIRSQASTSRTSGR